MLGLEVPYPIYERVKRLIAEHQGTIEDETFAADVTLMVNMPVDSIGAFSQALRDLSKGQVEPVVLDG